MCREHTNKLLQMVEDGLDRDVVINAFCKYLSEDDVKEMMEMNNFIDDGDEEEDENALEA